MAEPQVKCLGGCGRTHSRDNILCRVCWAATPEWMRGGWADLCAWLYDAHRRGADVAEMTARRRRLVQLRWVIIDEAAYRHLLPEDSCPPST